MSRKKEPSHITENQVFPMRLRGLMEEQQVTQKKLAYAIKMRPQTVSLYTTGQSAPDINTLKKIAEFFNVSADYLIGLTDVKKPDATIQAICEYTGFSESALSFIRYNEYSGLTDILDKLIQNERFRYALTYLSDMERDIQSIRACAKSYIGAPPDEKDWKSEQYFNCEDWLKSNFGSVVVSMGEYRRWRTYEIVRCFEDSINAIFDEISSN